MKEYLSVTWSCFFSEFYPNLVFWFRFWISLCITF